MLERNYHLGHPILICLNTVNLRIPKVHIIFCPSWGTKKRNAHGLLSCLRDKTLLILWFCSKSIKEVFYSPAKLNSHINTFFSCNLQDLIQKFRAASDLGQIVHCFEKMVPKIFSTPYSIPFLSILHKNKALHNFHKRGQHPTVEAMKGLDQGLT